MHAGRLGRGDHRVCRRVGIEARDVLGDGAAEQLHVLRQIADVRPQGFRRPLIERGAVDPDLALGGRPDADDGPRQGRLSRRAGADHAQPLARLELEGDALDDQPLAAGRAHAHAFEGERRGRFRQLHARLVGRQHGEQSVEAAPALARRGEAPPVGDRHLDRRQGARRQDRARDDDAGRRLLIDHEIGADPQHRRLQRHAQDARKPAQPAGDVGDALLRLEMAPVVVAPAQGQPSRPCPWRARPRRCGDWLRPAPSGCPPGRRLPAPAGGSGTRSGA